MNVSSRRFVRFRAFLAGALALVLSLPGAALADEPVVTLQSASGGSGEVQAQVGQPVELVVAKSRSGAPVSGGEPVSWTLEDGADGTLELLDEHTRDGADGVDPGTARVRFTPSRAGLHGIRATSPVDPACVDAGCRMAAHRFAVRATHPEAAADGDGHTAVIVGVAAAAGAIALAAIADTDGDDGAPGDRLVAVSGGGQSALTNNPLPAPLSVLAVSGGQAAAGVEIHWTATGGAVLSATTTTTSSSGGSSVSVLSVGPGPGPVTVTATRADAPAAVATFSIGVDIAGLMGVSGDNQTVRVEQTTAAPLVVQTTLNGSVQPGVDLVWQVVSGNATLSGVQSTSDGTGLAQAFVDAGPLPGPITVLVSRVDTPSAQLTFTINAVELRDLRLINGDGQSVAQGRPAPQGLVVLATDAGAADAGVTILWSATGGATLSAPTSVTDAGGFAAVNVTDIGYGVDPVTVTATRADSPLLSVQFTLNVLPPSLGVAGGDGQQGLAGTRAAAPLQVQLLDGAGGPMAGQTVTWQVTGGSAILDTPVSVTDAAGVASTGFTFGNFAGPVTITATAFGGAAVATFTATTQPPSPLAATGDGAAGNPGDALPISVQITDPAPDLSNIPITFTVLSGSASVAPATVLTDATGTAATTVTLGTTPGPVTIQASAPGGTTYTFNLTVNGTLIVTGTTAVSGNAQDLVIGVASAPMVVELLGNGTPLAGVTVTWTTTNGTMASPTTVTDAAGRTSNTVTIATAGTTIVTASYPTVNEFVGSSVQFTHNAPLAAIPNLPVNEASVAEALDAACAAIQTSPTPTPDEIDLVQQCQALIAASADPVAVNEALGEMLPDVAQTQADAGKAATSAQFDNLNGRIVQLRSGAPLAQVSFQGLNLAMSGGRVSLAELGNALLAQDGAEAAPPATEAGAEFSRWGVFFSGNIGRGEFDPTDLTPQYDFDVDGLTAGIDYRWSDRLVLGAAVGYTRQDTDLAGGQGHVDTQGLSLSGYTTWYSPNEWYVDGVLTLGWNRYDHERAIVYVLPGSVVNQTATADSDGTDVGATVTFGRDWAKRAWTYGVYGRAAYNRLQFDSFEEEVDSTINGNGLALGIDSRSVTGLSTTIGGKLSYAHSASWGVLVPQAQLEWLHDFRSDAEAFRGFFVDDPTQTPILVLGEDLDSDYFRLGIGLSMVLTNGRSGFVNYERILGRSGISQEMLTLGFRMEF